MNRLKITMKLTDLNLKELIEQAEEHNACADALAFLQSCSSMEEVLASKNAPEYAYWYACNVINGRWEEAEPIILTDGYWAYWYARDVIKGRWVEAEPIILTSAEWACRYASDVIRGRWVEAEILITKDINILIYYAHIVNLGFLMTMHLYIKSLFFNMKFGKT